MYYALRGGSYDLVVRQEEGLAVWWLIAVGFVVGLMPLTRPPRRFLIPIALVVLFAAWTAVSFGWTESDGNTLAEAARVLHFLGILVLVWSLVDRSNWRAAAGGVATAAVAVSLLALASRLAPGLFPSDLVARNFDATRLNYPFNYWNAVAAWGAMSIAMALPWSSHAERLATRALALAVVPACALAVYLSYSRAGVGGAAIGVVAAVAFSRNRWQTLVHAVAAAAGAALVIAVTRNQPQIAEATGTDGAATVVLVLAVAALLCAATAALTSRAGAHRWHLPSRIARSAGIAAAVIVIVAGALAAPGLADDAWDEFNSNAPTVSASDPASRLGGLGGNRHNIWDSALDAYRSEPFHGIGAGSFEFWWARNSGSNYEYLRDAHNLYLEQLAELGIVGFALVVLAAGSLLFVALRARRDLPGSPELGANAAMVTGFVVFLVHGGVDWMWEVTAIPALALTAVAVAAASSSRPGGALRWRWRIPIAVVALIAGLVQVPGLASNSLIRQSQAAVRAGDLEAAAADAQDAVDTQPWAAQPHVQAALVFQAQGRLERALTEARAAVRKEPTNARNWLVLSRIQAERGDARAALAAFRRAKRLRPGSPIFTPPPT